MTPRDTFISGISLLLIAALFFVIGGRDPPPRAKLTEVLGPLSYVESVRGRYGLSAVRFGVKTDPRNFQYHSKEGAVSDVLRALKQATASDVRITFDSTESHTPMLDDRSFHTAYELKVGGRTIRSYDQVRASWRGNNDVGLWVGYPAAVVGTLFMVLYFLKRGRA